MNAASVYQSAGSLRRSGVLSERARGIIGKGAKFSETAQAFGV